MPVRHLNEVCQPSGPVARIAIVTRTLAMPRPLFVHRDARQYELVGVTGTDAVWPAGLSGAALVVLVVPGWRRDPIAVLKMVHRHTPAPVVVLARGGSARGGSARQGSAREGSARGGSARLDPVAVLDAGADDLLSDPINPAEFWARVRGVMRRSTVSVADPSLPVGRYLVRLCDRTVRRIDGGRQLRLSPTQWRVLELLLRNPGTTVTSDDLVRYVWGDHRLGGRDYLRQYIMRLRRRLEDDASHPRHLVTDPGRGYRYES